MPDPRPPLDPALKDWLDRVIVPALVRRYLAERGISGAVAPKQPEAVQPHDEPLLRERVQ